jgi:hypothetical protein
MYSQMFRCLIVMLLILPFVPEQSALSIKALDKLMDGSEFKVTANDAFVDEQLLLFVTKSS